MSSAGSNMEMMPVQPHRQNGSPKLSLHQASDASSIASSTANSNAASLTPGSPAANGSATNVDFSAIPLNEIVQQLSTSIELGLTEAEVLRRRAEQGPNELKTRSRPSLLKIFLANCSNALLLILLASAIVSLALGDYPEGIAILMIIVINATLATYTEKSSGDALAALLDMTAPVCQTRRILIAPVVPGADGPDGSALPQPVSSTAKVPLQGLPNFVAAGGGIDEETPASSAGSTTVITIPSRDLVIGDIVILSSGSVVPADIRLIEANDCRVDESMLTGESKEVPKEANWKPSGSAAVLSPGNMLFSGTNMTTGRAVGVVTAIGMNTRLGRIAALLLSGGDKNAEGATDDEDEYDDEDAEEDRPLLFADDHETELAMMGGSTVGIASPATPRGRADSRALRALRRRQSERVLELEYDMRRDMPEAHQHAFIDASVHTILPANASGQHEALKAALAESAAEKEKTKQVEYRKKAAKEKAKSAHAAAQKQKKEKKKGKQTPLQKSLASLALYMSLVALIACILVFVVGIGRDYQDPAHPDKEVWLVMLLTAVSLAVSAIPEGLPLAVTICLAMGSTRLAKAKTLVRQLPAVENLGMVTVICSDKTGTITQGKMTATHLFTQGREWRFTRPEGFAPVGTLACNGTEIVSMPLADRVAPLFTLLLSGVLCNDTELVHEEDKEGEAGSKKVTVKGSMTEAPLVVGATKVGLVKGKSDVHFNRLAEVPFNSARKLMATLHSNGVAPGIVDASSEVTSSAPNAPSTANAPLSEPMMSSVPPRIPTIHEESHDDEKVQEDQVRIHYDQGESGDHGANMKPLTITPPAPTTAPQASTNSTIQRRGLGHGPSPSTVTRSLILGATAKTDSRPDAFSMAVGKLISTPTFAAIKGAPNYVLDTCTQIVSSNGTIEELSSEKRREILTMVDELSAQALRVLAVAFKPFEKDPSASLHEMDGDAKLTLLASDAVFVGFVGILDPPRNGIKDAIETASEAGVKTVMITGDYLLTAISIAKSVGLIPLGADAVGGIARDAKDLRVPNSQNSYLSEVQIDDITNSTLVFARATPEDKLVIVKSLQRLGHIVAMTGDGGQLQHNHRRLDFLKSNDRHSHLQMLFAYSSFFNCF